MTRGVVARLGPPNGTKPACQSGRRLLIDAALLGSYCGRLTLWAGRVRPGRGECLTSLVASTLLAEEDAILRRTAVHREVVESEQCGGRALR